MPVLADQCIFLTCVSTEKLCQLACWFSATRIGPAWFRHDMSYPGSLHLGLSSSAMIRSRGLVGALLVVQCSGDGIDPLSLAPQQDLRTRRQVKLERNEDRCLQANEWGTPLGDLEYLVGQI